MTTTAVGSTGVAGSNGIDAATRDKILDLGTSDRAVLDLIQQKFSDKDLTPQQQNEIQFLFSRRQQDSSLISNLLRAAFDTASSVIRNIRGS